MGHYSLLLINHDFVSHIEDNPAEFWRHAWHAITQSSSVAQPFGIGSVYPVGVAVCQDQASASLRLILTDGVSAETIIQQASSLLPSEEEAQLEILREAAKKRGYRLTKIPAPKIPKPKKETKKHVTKTASKNKT